MKKQIIHDFQEVTVDGKIVLRSERDLKILPQQPTLVYLNANWVNLLKKYHYICYLHENISNKGCVILNVSAIDEKTQISINVYNLSNQTVKININDIVCYFLIVESFKCVKMLDSQKNLLIL